MYDNIIVDAINNCNPPKQSKLFKVLNNIREADKQQEVAEKLINIVATRSDSKRGSSASSLALTLADNICWMSGVSPLDPPLLKEQGMLGVGGDILNWFVEADLGKMELFKMINSKHSQWFFMPTGPFKGYCDLEVRDRTIPDLTDSPFEWIAPVMKVNNNKMELVKRCSSVGLSYRYLYEKIPHVYTAINRLNAQQWVINPFIRDIAAVAGNPFLPERIELEELKDAKKHLNNLNRKAISRREWIAKQIVGELLKEAVGDKGEQKAHNKANNIASRNAMDFYQEGR